MHREFLDLYNRELKLLHEHGREFAEDFPGVADRLGGLLQEQTDPMIAGLLQGAAFLAARVQLKLKHEFSEFTNNLIEQLLPAYLAPTPSVFLAQVKPIYGDTALRDGFRVKRGAYIDATYRERDTQVACRFRLTSDIVLSPFEIVSAEYFPTLGGLHAMGVSPEGRVISGLRLSLTHRSAPRPDDEIFTPEANKRPELHFAGCRIDDLKIYLGGQEADAIALYEQFFAHCSGVYVRYLDSFGDPKVVKAAPDCLHQIGFGEAEALLPNDNRIFRGYDFLREYFMFPRKFLGLRLTGLQKIFSRIPSRNIDIVFAFDELNARLSAAAQPGMFLLNAAPAVNLFEMPTDRISVKSNQHEYQVVPDRSRPLDYEAHRVLEVYAHYAGGGQKTSVYPLYSASTDNRLATPDLCYTVRRLRRRQTTKEKRLGQVSVYSGTEMFISLTEPAGARDENAVSELSVRALCSNRHLTEHLPIGQGGADFRLVEKQEFAVQCLFGPTPPREPVVTQQRSRAGDTHTGAVAWRLVNMLSLNHLGLVERGAGKNAQAVRETLSIFADLSDVVTERRIQGVKSIESNAVVRRVRHKNGVGAARGIEIVVTLDDRAFEGAGVFLIGAVLDRFFCEYAALNHFTQTVVRSTERGEVMRWPIRYGARRPL
jgi:type VI secretion system protein ImpG